MPSKLRATRTDSPALRPIAVAVASVLGSPFILATAQAQQGPLEEIVVTASRREATVQELPFNIAAVGNEALSRQRLTRLGDFSRWIPGLTVVDQGARGSDIMTVRGLNVSSLNASEFLDNTSGDTVATYIGEIPVYMDMRIKDVDRVEVLIGPQGTLYGAGTLGGAVRYIPARPDTNEFTLDIQGNLFDLAEGDGLGHETDIVVNVPIAADKLAFRGSFSYLDDPGFIDYPYLVREAGVSNPQPDFSDPADVATNLFSVDDANTEETLSARLALLWKISTSVEATLNYYFQEQKAGARTINHRDAFDTGNYESAHRFLEPNDRENSLLSLEVVADLGFAELTSATGLSSYEEAGQRDQSDLLLDFEYGYETFPSFAAFTREAGSEDRINQELRLVSTGDGSISWIAGLFYNDYDTDYLTQEFTPGIPEWFGLAPPPLPTGDLEYEQITIESLKEHAIFGEISFALSDRLDFTVGGRYFEYETEQFVDFDIPLIDFGSEETTLAEDDGFLGKLNLSYSFSNEIMGYMTLSEGFRIGGANSIAECVLPLQPGQNVCALPHEKSIDPDRTTNFEIGVHSTLAEGRVVLNAAVYTIDWDDIQTESVTENGGVPITVNGGSAQSQGVELSFETRGAGPWSIRGNYAYNDAKLTSDAPGLVDGADAFDGDRLSGTPEQQASLYLAYGRTLSNGWDIDAAWGVTTTSDVLTKVGLRSDGEILGGYSIHSASVRLSQDRWSATLYADNLTNKFAETAVRQDPTLIRNVGGFDLRRYFRNVLRPRSVGVEFRYSFGD